MLVMQSEIGEIFLYSTDEVDIKEQRLIKYKNSVSNNSLSGISINQNSKYIAIRGGQLNGSIDIYEISLPVSMKSVGGVFENVTFKLPV